MSKPVCRNFSHVCRWGAVSMVKGVGLEERFCALLERGPIRQTLPRFAPWLAAAVAIGGALSLNAFQLREASAHARASSAKSTIIAAETHWVVANGDDAVLPEGVTVHAIGASEVSAKGDSDARSLDRVWWHPDGTLYASPPQIGDDKIVREGLVHIPHGPRRLRFAVRIGNLPKHQDTGFGPVSKNRFGGSNLVTTSGIPGGLIWLLDCSVPGDAREESLTVCVSHGPWKEILRRPLTWSPVSPLRSWVDVRSEVLSRSPRKAVQVHAESDTYAAAHVYPIASAQPGTSEFGVRLARRDVIDGHGSDWRYFLLDKDGHRLNSRNLQESGLNSDFLVKFSTDEKTARRAAFVGVESRPFLNVTFNHLAVRPKTMTRKILR